MSNAIYSPASINCNGSLLCRSFRLLNISKPTAPNMHLQPYKLVLMFFFFYFKQALAFSLIWFFFKFQLASFVFILFRYFNLLIPFFDILLYYLSILLNIFYFDCKITKKFVRNYLAILQKERKKVKIGKEGGVAGWRERKKERKRKKEKKKKKKKCLWWG